MLLRVTLDAQETRKHKVKQVTVNVRTKTAG